MSSNLINKKHLKEWFSRPPEKAVCSNPDCNFPHWIDIECSCGCGDVVPNSDENIHKYVKKWENSKKECIYCKKEYKWNPKLWDEYQFYLTMQGLPVGTGILDMGEFCSKRCFDLSLNKAAH